MTGGIIQLVARGVEDVFLSIEPQITFFKVIYRRHTNFSREEIPQEFIHEPNFGKRSTCKISPDTGDMIDKMTLKITLPCIPKLSQTNDNEYNCGNNNCNNNELKIAWIRKIGFAMIKYVEIEINGKVIDRHYGEWLYIWTYLTTKNIDDHGLSKLIGDVPELTNFTESKEEYILYVPLHFWFCRATGLALPMVGLWFSEIKINLEFYELDKCYVISPTHYVKCVDDIVNFLPYEYLYQKGLDGVERYGIFSHYDSINQRLYYTSINDRLTGIPHDHYGVDPTTMNETARNVILNTNKADKYIIRGVSSDFTVKPDICVKSVSVHKKSLKHIKLKECHVLTDFVYLDDDERMKFAQNKHDYLIEQLYYTPNVPIDSNNAGIRLDIDQSCKLMVWLAQLDYISEFNDRFNYTDSHIRRKIYDPYINTDNDCTKIKMYDCIRVEDVIGNSLIDEDLIKLDSQDRLSCRPNAYFELIQANQYSNNSLPKGTGMYSYGINPLDTKPTGTTNMSQINLIELKLRMNHCINTTHRAKFRAYGLCYNVWRVDNGLSAPIFIR